MEPLKHVPCLCGHDDYRVLYDRPYALTSDHLGDFLATTDRFENYGRIVRCRRCALVYTNPRLEDSLIFRGYADSRDENYVEEASNRSINAHISVGALRRFRKGGRLLEVGSSLGYFLNAARVDYEVTGVEASRWAAEEARRKFGVPVKTGSLQEQHFEDGGFDIVCQIDVIEHVTDPVALLNECCRVLKPGGLLYVVTPDIDSLSAMLLRGKWWGLRPAPLYYFSRRTLTDLLEKIGLEIVLARSFGRIFSLGYWASRLKSYPALVHRPIDRVIYLLDIHEKLMYINTRDSMELVAKKRG